LVRATSNYNDTIIDGGRAGSVVTIQFASDAALEGFTIRNGTGTWFGMGENAGGGVFCYNARCRVSNCRDAAPVFTSMGAG
jgi:hypothetical protein